MKAVGRVWLHAIVVVHQNGYLLIEIVGDHFSWVMGPNLNSVTMSLATSSLFFLP